ncbi:MAG: phenylalanine--tRNA ligase subunit beta [Granulosicoccus sp.]
MKISERWLREWINPPVDTAELAAQLTLLGLEVDEVQPAHPGFSDVVVARIEKVSPHPDADRLRVCEVDNGNAELVQIVCGAPNARTGLVTALANVGGTLPDGTRLKKAKLRGVESFGMLCSAAELGLSDEGKGIVEFPDDAPVGKSLHAWLELEDAIIEVELTPDRGDCLSIRGIARDLSARNDLPLTLREINTAVIQSGVTQAVEVDNACACVRYAGRVIAGIDLSRRTPVWMVERLRRGGVRSINLAVDVTNYVMLELGQPMHAFDCKKIQGAIQVRLARKAERLVLLDGREVELQTGTTVIADDSGAIGIAGIMGGLSTAVDESTTDLFFESALFLANEIIGKPRSYGLHTESSQRFERGVDPAGQTEALEYASGLLITLAGGKAGAITDMQIVERMPVPIALTVRQSRLKRILGMEVASDEVTRLFKQLGIDCTPTDSGWSVIAPGYRYDLQVEEDFIADIGRMYGYDKLPRTLLAHTPQLHAVPETQVSPLEIKQRLAARGFQEVVTYSFVEAAQQSLLRPDLKALPLANPISSEMGVMRTTLVGGLIDVMRHNQSRQLASMRLFETGLRFLPLPDSQSADSVDPVIVAGHGDDQQIDKQLQQQNMLCGLVTGRLNAENWNSGVDDNDFYSAKADVAALFARANAGVVEYLPCALDMLHPGQRATITVKGISVGFIGALNPALQNKLNLSSLPFVFELSLAALLTARVPAARLLSRYPQVRRDIALLVDDAVTHQSLVDTVRQASPEMLQEVLVFDVYLGKKVVKGKKSMALGLILQDFSRTLEDAEVEKAVTHIVESLGREHGAELRA